MSAIAAGTRVSRTMNASASAPTASGRPGAEHLAVLAVWALAGLAVLVVAGTRARLRRAVPVGA